MVKACDLIAWRCIWRWWNNEFLSCLRYWGQIVCVYCLLLFLDLLSILLFSLVSGRELPHFLSHYYKICLLFFFTGHMTLCTKNWLQIQSYLRVWTFQSKMFQSHLKPVEVLLIAQLLQWNQIPELFLHLVTLTVSKRSGVGGQCEVVEGEESQLQSLEAAWSEKP